MKVCYIGFALHLFATANDIALRQFSVFILMPGTTNQNTFIVICSDEKNKQIFQNTVA